MNEEEKTFLNEEEKEDNKYHKSYNKDDDCLYNQSKRIITYISNNEEVVNCACGVIASVIMLATFGLIL